LLDDSRHAKEFFAGPADRVLVEAVGLLRRRKRGVKEAHGAVDHAQSPRGALPRWSEVHT
jgi:hypothetical protein